MLHIARAIPIPTPIVCYVTDRASLVHPDTRSVSAAANLLDPLLHRIASVSAAGIDWIQLREKDLSGSHCSGLVRAALAACTADQRILVNDRLDVALTERAHGVHLGENSLAISDAQRLIGNFAPENPSRQFIAGVSCHSLSSALAAAAAGADYIFFGPIFATPSKQKFGEPQGLAKLSAVCGEVGIPVLAIGGITPENTALCLAAGAAGIAAIRMFQEAEDLPRLINALRPSRRG
jgi:thiamine-phosphate pyrophosphorylase